MIQQYHLTGAELGILADVLVSLYMKSFKDDPCERCSPMERMACCGCERAREYAKAIKPAKDAGLEIPLKDMLRVQGLYRELHDAQVNVKVAEENIKAKYGCGDVLLRMAARS